MVFLYIYFACFRILLHYLRGARFLRWWLLNYPVKTSSVLSFTHRGSFISWILVIWKWTLSSPMGDDPTIPEIPVSNKLKYKFNTCDNTEQYNIFFFRKSNFCHKSHHFYPLGSFGIRLKTPWGTSNILSAFVCHTYFTSCTKIVV